MLVKLLKKMLREEERGVKQIIWQSFRKDYYPLDLKIYCLYINTDEINKFT